MADGESIRDMNGHTKVLSAQKGMHRLGADKEDKWAMIFEDVFKAEKWTL